MLQKSSPFWFIVLESLSEPENADLSVIFILKFEQRTEASFRKSVQRSVRWVTQICNCICYLPSDRVTAASPSSTQKAHECSRRAQCLGMWTFKVPSACLKKLKQLLQNALEIEDTCIYSDICKAGWSRHRDLWAAGVQKSCNWL